MLNYATVDNVYPIISLIHNNTFSICIYYNNKSIIYKLNKNKNDDFLIRNFNVCYYIYNQNDIVRRILNSFEL